MTTIEVTCDCGRVYVLPADKEGRKLQCRRCGAVVTIRRDAAPGVVIPFTGVSGGDDSDEVTKGPETPTKPAGKGKPSPRPALRRCPRCGFQDDPAIVVCVRCGVDFRDAAPPPQVTKSAARIKAEAPRLESESDEWASRIEVLAKISFVPIAGIVPGLAALVLSAFGNSSLRQLPSPARRALESRLGAARLIAVATVLIWTGLISFYVFVYRPQRKNDIREGLVQGCRLHLESLGTGIRATRRESGRFPADTRLTIADGLRRLADSHELGEAVLSCPLLGGERYAIDSGLRAIEARTTDDYLIAWDSVPHAEPDGGLRWFALRADGRVEEFRSAPQLEKARARPSERFELPAPPPAPTKQGTTTNPTPVEEGFESRRQALLAFSEELDKADPKLERKITLADFEKRVGLTVIETVPRVNQAAEDVLKLATARLVARLDVPGPEMLRLARQLEADADPETRLVLVLGLKRAGAPAWLHACAGLALESTPPVSERALALVHDEARSGPEGLKRVLLEARDRRELSKISSDQPIFALTPDIYPTLAEFLADSDVAAEALAVLSRGNEKVEEALGTAFDHKEPRVREQALRALRASLAWRDAPLAPFYDRLAREGDRNVRAALLQVLLDSVDSKVVLRALEALREGGRGDSLTGVARKILGAAKDDESLDEIVNELDHAGASRDEVVSELRRGSRILDDSTSEALARRAPFLQASGQEVAVVLAALRYDDVAHRLLVRLATSSAASTVRDAAWRALTDGSRLDGKVRAEVQEALAKRLFKESDPQVRQQIVTLLGRYEYRSQAGFSALEQLARKASESNEIRESAVSALSLSNDPRVVRVLIELVDVLSGHAKWATTLKLREITGASSQPLTSAEWTRIAHQTESDTKKKLRDRDDRERSDFRDRQDQTEAHLKDLRSRGL